jgi:hypothetical protein
MVQLAYFRAGLGNPGTVGITETEERIHAGEQSSPSVEKSRANFDDRRCPHGRRRCRLVGDGLAGAADLELSSAALS